MKIFITFCTLIFSLSSFSQVYVSGFNMDYSGFTRFMERVEGDYRSSQIVADFVSGIESRYGVTCSKQASVQFSSLSNRTSFKTRCTGDSHLKIKIVSNTNELSDGSFQFNVVKEIIKRK